MLSLRYLLAGHNLRFGCRHLSTFSHIGPRLVRLHQGWQKVELFEGFRTHCCPKLHCVADEHVILIIGACSGRVMEQFYKAYRIDSGSLFGILCSLQLILSFADSMEWTCHGLPGRLCYYARWSYDSSFDQALECSDQLVGLVGLRQEMFDSGPIDF